jgi:anti-sigma regulatory factor (Ser/Thr protein kinase)
MTAGDPPVSPPSARAAGGGPLLEQEFGSGMLCGLRAAVLAHAVAAGMPEDRAGDVVIAVHELAANAIRHGAGRGRLRMWSRAGSLHCMVEDGARPGLPARAGPRPGRQDGEGRNVAARWPYEHGHGLWLVRLLADQMSIVSGADGTRAAVRFMLPGLSGNGTASGGSGPARIIQRKNNV